MVVTRSMSGTTKKADTKVAVNDKVAERGSKKTTAERGSKKTTAGRARKKTHAERARKQLSAEEFMLSHTARYLFIDNTFIPQFCEKHPDVILTYAKHLEVGEAGTKEWYSMTDSDRAPYVAEAKKKIAEVKMRYKAEHDRIGEGISEPFYKVNLA